MFSSDLVVKSAFPTGKKLGLAFHPSLTASPIARERPGPRARARGESRVSSIA